MAVRDGRTGLILDDPYDVEGLAALLRRAGSVDLAAWGEEAATSVDEFRRDAVMQRVEALVFGPEPAGDWSQRSASSALQGPVR